MVPASGDFQTFFRSAAEATAAMATTTIEARARLRRMATLLRDFVLNCVAG
jgi:hypothetical protein